MLAFQVAKGEKRFLPDQRHRNPLTISYRRTNAGIRGSAWEHELIKLETASPVCFLAYVLSSAEVIDLIFYLLTVNST